MATRRKSDLGKVLLDSFYNIPREEKQPCTAEEKAIQDVRQLLCFMEKQVQGTVSEKDRKEAAAKSKQWAESISIVKTFFNTK